MFIRKSYFAVIKTEDDHQYYLPNLTSAPYELQAQTTVQTYFSSITLSAWGKLPQTT